MSGIGRGTAERMGEIRQERIREPDEQEAARWQVMLKSIRSGRKWLYVVVFLGVLAGVTGAGCERGRRGAEVHGRGQGSILDFEWVVASELTVLVATPAAHVPRRHQRTHVIRSDGELAGRFVEWQGACARGGLSISTSRP